MLNLISALLLSINYANAASLNMRPGLWEVEMQVMQNGKKTDPMAQMKKMMEKIPPEQRKMIMEQMKKKGATPDGLSEVCYTEEMIRDPKSLSEGKEKKNCNYKITSSTATKMETAFTCKDGSSGTAVWETKTPTSMRGDIKGKDKKGKTYEMVYNSKFIKSDCGKYQPKKK